MQDIISFVFFFVYLMFANKYFNTHETWPIVNVVTMSYHISDVSQNFSESKKTRLKKTNYL